MPDLSFNDRVETALAALQAIGDGTWDEIHPTPERYSSAEKAKIIHDHVQNVAKLSLWQDAILDVPLEECDERTFLLEDLLNRRVQEASSIIMSLSLVN